jgi:hypothetical protein
MLDTRTLTPAGRFESLKLISPWLNGVPGGPGKDTGKVRPVKLKEPVLGN